jgi:hypothetical protein
LTNKDLKQLPAIDKETGEVYTGYETPGKNSWQKANDINFDFLKNA